MLFGGIRWGARECEGVQKVEGDRGWYTIRGISCTLKMCIQQPKRWWVVLPVKAIDRRSERYGERTTSWQRWNHQPNGWQYGIRRMRQAQYSLTPTKCAAKRRNCCRCMKTEDKSRENGQADVSVFGMLQRYFVGMVAFNLLILPYRCWRRIYASMPCLQHTHTHSHSGSQHYHHHHQPVSIAYQMVPMQIAGVSCMTM